VIYLWTYRDAGFWRPNDDLIQIYYDHSIQRLVAKKEEARVEAVMSEVAGLLSSPRVLMSAKDMCLTFSSNTSVEIIKGF
jgi:hypothetical protein